MKVVVGKRAYQMSQKEYKGLLEIASEQVPFGVYAIEKQNYAELRNDKCTSSTKLKAMIRQYNAAGYKVHYNGR